MCASWTVESEPTPNLLNLTRSELTSFVQTNLSLPRFRADQLFQWLWQKLATDFECMSNLSKGIREQLLKQARIVWPKVVQKQISADQTTKFLLELEDGALIETVLIPATDHEGRVRWSQCLSTQVGCAMGCTFCATGGMGLQRNLRMSEILGQVLVGRAYLNDLRSDHPILRNVVFMGMGEPLANIKELLRSLETLNEPLGLAFSPRRITVSTCGLKEGLRAFGEQGLAYLAVSLHAPNQELRSQLMPKAAVWPLNELITSLAAYPLKKRERITFEYLLLGGVNDNKEHALELAGLVQKVNAKLNLIVYNPTPTSRYTAPSPSRVLDFEKVLWKKDIVAIVRQSKGQDIDAACGQLRSRILNPN